MRRIVAWLLVVLGALVALPFGAAAAWVGTDDTATTGPHPLASSGVAVQSHAEVIRYVGPVLHLSVTRADGGPVFLGIASEVDAESYLEGHSRSVVSRLGLPWDVDVQEPAGSTDPVPVPAEQAWWLASAAGEGTQGLVWPIPHGRYSIIALNADGTPVVDVGVTMGLELAGTFYALLAAAASGLLLILLGSWLLLARRRRGPPGAVGLAPATSPPLDQPAAQPGPGSGAVSR